MDASPEPWEFPSRAASRAGWTFPIGRTEVRDALLDAQVRVRYLSFGGGYDGGPYGLVRRLPARSVIRSWWSADTNPLRRAVLDDDGRRVGWAGLDVSMVRSEDAARTRSLLVGGLLHEGVEWISAIDARGDGWRASDHELVVFLDGSGTRRTES